MNTTEANNPAKMKVDIWSDIRCPFCYIGKRKFEAALEQFPQKELIEIEWHSFELDPELETDTTKDVYDYLAERKGMSREALVRMHGQVSSTAKEAGLEYNFEKAVVANSFNAHRLAALAKSKGLGDAAEEAIFRAYFTEGKNIDDKETLVAIGKEIGIHEDETRFVMDSNEYADEVRKDQAKAQAYGVRGVPFFVLNDKYAVSGAQPSDVFSGALQQAWTEYERENPKLINLADGAACDMDGNCNN